MCTLQFFLPGQKWYGWCHRAHTADPGFVHPWTERPSLRQGDWGSRVGPDTNWGRHRNMVAGTTAEFLPLHSNGVRKTLKGGFFTCTVSTICTGMSAVHVLVCVSHVIMGSESQLFSVCMVWVTLLWVLVGNTCCKWCLICPCIDAVLRLADEKGHTHFHPIRSSSLPSPRIQNNFSVNAEELWSSSPGPSTSMHHFIPPTDPPSSLTLPNIEVPFWGMICVHIWSVCSLVPRPSPTPFLDCICDLSTRSRPGTTPTSSND